MIARRIFLCLTLAAIVFAAIFLLRKTPAKPRDVTIQFTAGVRGRLVPCGWFSGQMGGLTRSATLLRSRSAENVLRFDAGAISTNAGR